MFKKLVSVLLVSLVLLPTCSAFAYSISSSYYGSHTEIYYDGTTKAFTKKIGTATHSYTLDYIAPPKGSTASIYYYGASNSGTTLAKAGTATSVTINTKPTFNSSFPNEGKNAKISFTSGKWTIKYKDTDKVAKDGTHTTQSNVATKTGSFSASKTHS